jgi:hypothetical protein
MKILGLKTFLVLGVWVAFCAASVAGAQDAERPRALQIEAVEVIRPSGPALDQATQFDAIKFDVIRAESIDERRELRRRMRRRWHYAKPEEREQMRDQREQWQRELREGISDDERQGLRRRMRAREQRRTEIRSLPEAERQALRDRMKQDVGEERAALRQRLREVDPAERELLRQNLRAFRRLEAEEQRVLRENLDELRELPASAREQLDTNRRRWESMSADEREALRRRMRQLREMTPARRHQLLDRALPPGGESDGSPNSRDGGAAPTSRGTAP